jgi:hypothetical protein
MVLLIVNILAAFVAVALIGLVLRGTLYHVFARTRAGDLKHPRDWQAGDWMRVGVGLYHVKALIRIARWDLYQPLWQLAENPDYTRSASAALWNTGFSLAAIVGSLAVLYALYRNIPAKERCNYSIISAAFWPGRPPFFFGRIP